MSSAASPFNVTGSNQPGAIINMYGGTGNPAMGTGGPGNVGFGNAANPTPSQPPAANPYVPANSTFAQPGGVSLNPGTSSPTSSILPGATQQTTQQQNDTLAGLEQTYGTGMGSLVGQYLASNGGYNSALTTQTVDAQTALMQQQIGVGAGALETNLAESGISPNSSVAALEMSNYEANATLGENSVTAQDFLNMYQSSQANELSELESVQGTVATNKANSSGIMGILGGLLGLGQAGAGLASGLTSAFDPGADTSILDAIASF